MSTQTAYREVPHLEPDVSLEHRLELFSLILAPPAGELHSPLSDHTACEALSASFRGKLCQQLAELQARHLEAGQHLYRMGNPARSVFLVRTGLLKTSTISPAGEELTLALHKPGDLLGELC